MLVVLNIDGLVINDVNLNDQINTWVLRIVLCYQITNHVVFEFVNFDKIVISVVFGLTNIVKYLYDDTTQTRHADMNCHL